ncbi:MAG: T9SS type A sorting domain-containing protein [Flavobacterium sp.]|nr:MAG: T9SS type A sorting domain-containing protein [Flavobacterium sp.]
MRKILLFALLLTVQFASAQNTAICSGAESLCGSLGQPFLNTTGMSNGTPGISCLITTPNPKWFYIPVSESGSLNFQIVQRDFNQQLIDVDFIVWGPFTSLSDGCENLTQANVKGCSYSANATENLSLTNTIAGEYYILMVTNYSDDPGYITISEMPGSTAAMECSGIRVNAFIDTNGNDIQDDGEIPFQLGNFTYEKNNDGIAHVVSEPDGNISIYDETLSNTYSLGYEVSPQYQEYYAVATPGYTNVTVEPGTLVMTYNFPIIIIQEYQDVEVQLVPTNSPRPGFAYTNTIFYTNKGTEAIPSGSVIFMQDAATTIASISPAGAATTATGFQYNFTNLLPFETRQLTVIINVPTIPTVSLGDLLTTPVSVTAADNDAIAENNTSSNTQEIIGSYDPNDKMESRGRYIVFSEFSADDYLYYTIRFQNSGTASAINVRIEDVLDSQLDKNSVEMLRSSHSYSMDRIDNELTWTFDNIMLPAEIDNEPASHGYVYFRVKPVAGFAVGDIIPNGADIYFDFNPAITTETFLSEFITALGTKNNFVSQFTMHPNPAENVLHITPGSVGINIEDVKIYDILGKTIFEKQNNDASAMQIDVDGFGSGMYFVEITDNNGKTSIKKLMIK